MYNYNENTGVGLAMEVPEIEAIVTVRPVTGASYTFWKDKRKWSRYSRFEDMFGFIDYGNDDYYDPSAPSPADETIILTPNIFSSRLLDYNNKSVMFDEYVAKTFGKIGNNNKIATFDFTFRGNYKFKYAEHYMYEIDKAGLNFDDGSIEIPTVPEDFHPMFDYFNADFTIQPHPKYVGDDNIWGHSFVIPVPVLSTREMNDDEYDKFERFFDELEAKFGGLRRKMIVRQEGVLNGEDVVVYKNMNGDVLEIVRKEDDEEILEDDED